MNSLRRYSILKTKAVSAHRARFERVNFAFEQLPVDFIQTGILFETSLERYSKLRIKNARAANSALRNTNRGVTVKSSRHENAVQSGIKSFTRA